MKIIKKLNESELAPIKDELRNAAHLWSDHEYGDIKYQPLKHGQSITISGFESDNRFLFPLTISSVADMLSLPHSHLRRVYWHRLNPGQRIDAHVDVGPYFESIIRYQVYLDVLPDHKAHHGKDVYSEELTNALVEFDASKMHWYKNNSDQPMIFLVIDFLKSGASGGTRTPDNPGRSRML